LFVLWVWGARETGDLADDCGLAKGTLSGMLNTLERADLVTREKHPDDGRRVVVDLLPKGHATIERVFPRFNEFEARFTERLTEDDMASMARLLRVVTATASGSDLVAGEVGSG
jgi:DNA-binding MarR family transcriptional regulator